MSCTRGPSCGIAPRRPAVDARRRHLPGVPVPSSDRYLAGRLARASVRRHPASPGRRYSDICKPIGTSTRSLLNRTIRLECHAAVRRLREAQDTLAVADAVLADGPVSAFREFYRPPFTLQMQAAVIQLTRPVRIRASRSGRAVVRRGRHRGSRALLSWRTGICTGHAWFCIHVKDVEAPAAMSGPGRPAPRATIRRTSSCFRLSSSSRAPSVLPLTMGT